RETVWKHYARFTKPNSEARRAVKLACPRTYSDITRPTSDCCFSRRFEMRIFSMIAIATAMISGPAGAFAGELPSYEVNSFPISASQVQLLGAVGVEEQRATPTLPVAGIPASPAQIAVLSPRIKVIASANTSSEQR